MLAPLNAIAGAVAGVRLELKGPVAALHYRAAPEAEADCLAAAAEAAAILPGLVMQAGKMVVEVKPDTAHKGSALRRMMQAPPFAGRRPVMLGDDTTDEDAIVVAEALGGIGVKIGPGPSAASLRAFDPVAARLDRPGGDRRLARPDPPPLHAGRPSNGCASSSGLAFGKSQFSLRSQVFQFG